MLSYLETLSCHYVEYHAVEAMLDSMPDNKEEDCAKEPTEISVCETNVTSDTQIKSGTVDSTCF